MPGLSSRLLTVLCCCRTARSAVAPGAAVCPPPGAGARATEFGRHIDQRLDRRLYHLLHQLERVVHEGLDVRERRVMQRLVLVRHAVIPPRVLIEGATRAHRRLRSW